jgi:hypothetical protein
MLRRSVLIVSLLFALGCDSEGPPLCRCTMSFDSVRFAVVGPNGSPESGVTIFVLQPRTGDVLDVDQPRSFEGQYDAVNDSFRRRLEASGDTLLILGGKGQRQFQVKFVVGVDEPCSCHVYKIAGPDSVLLPVSNLTGRCSRRRRAGACESSIARRSRRRG